MPQYPRLSSDHPRPFQTFFKNLEIKTCQLFVFTWLYLSVFVSRYCRGCVYGALVMAITTKRTRFSRRLPDHVTDELVNVLSEKKIFGFNDLFERVFANLKLRNAVSGGEEMLRLRAYEKLQNLVTRGLVEKTGKEYKGTARVHEASSSYAAAQEAAAIQD